jgi:hypothetical protein
MSPNPLLLLAFMTDLVWAAPVMGMVVCGVAFVLGRRFLSTPPPSPEVPDVADSLKGVTQDRRSTPRRKGNPIAVHLTAAQDTEPIVGWVLDRSFGGLNILIDNPIPEGTFLKVRPCKDGEALPWIDISVRSCRRSEGRHVIGCQFSRTPSWNLLLQFG